MRYVSTHMPLLLLAAAVLTWIAPQDPRLDIHGLPWLAENKGELIRLPYRLKAELPPAVWNLGRVSERRAHPFSNGLDARCD